MPVIHVIVERFRQACRGRGLDGMVSLADELEALLDDVCPGWQKPAADEAVLVSNDSFGPWGRKGSPLDWAFELRSKISDALSLECSVGIAHTRIAARICARMARPRGILVWMEGHESTLLGGLALEELLELDELRPEQLVRLRSRGIRTVDELACLAPAEARELLGLEGTKLLGLVRGLDPAADTSPGAGARAGRLERAVRLLSRRLSRRLEHAQRRARGLELQVAHADGILDERYTLLPRPASKSEEIQTRAARLVEMLPRRPEPVVGVALAATGLTRVVGQLDLFVSGPPREVRVSLGRLSTTTASALDFDAETRSPSAPSGSPV